MQDEGRPTATARLAAAKHKAFLADPRSADKRARDAEPRPEPAPPVVVAPLVSEAALASTMALEGAAAPLLVTAHAIVEAVAVKFKLTFAEAMADFRPPAVAARKIAAALVVRRVEIDVTEVSRLLDMPRDAIVDGLLLIDPILRERAIPRKAPLPDVLQLIFDCQSITAEARKITVDDIRRAVCAEFGVRSIDLLSSRRTADVVAPRQIAMAIAKRLTLKSLPELGRRFGGRDHTTVLHAVRKWEPVLDAVAPTLPPDAKIIDWVRAIRASSARPADRRNPRNRLAAIAA